MLLLIVGIIVAGPFIAAGGAVVLRPVLSKLGLEGRLAVDGAAEHPKENNDEQGAHRRRNMRTAPTLGVPGVARDVDLPRDERMDAIERVSGAVSVMLTKTSLWPLSFLFNSQE